MRRFVLGHLRRHRVPLAALGAWSLAESLPSLVSGYATARAVDDGFLAHRPLVGLAWLAAFGASGAVGALGARGGYRSLGRVVEPLRDTLAREVVATGLRRSTAPPQRPDEAAAARLTHQVEIARDTFAGLLMVVRSFLLTSVAAAIGLSALSPVLVPLVLGPVLAGVALFAVLMPASAARQRAYVRADERLAEAAGAVLAGHQDIVACGARDRAARWVPVGEQASAERALARIGALRALCLAVGGWSPLVVLLAAAPWLVHDRGVPAGAVLGAVVYVLQALQPALHTLVNGVASGGLRFGVTLNRLLAKDAAPVTVPPPGRGGAGGVTLRGVTYRYGPHARPVLDGLDLDVPDGDHLAVVGPSGVGKSTLAAVVAGLLAPQSGEVTLRGDRVLIPQEAYVFSGTVRDNLTYLSGDSVSDRAVGAAVAAVGAGDLVRRLGGLDAGVDPARLSAGERQLLALARAYLSPAPLAILDEATCHLDPAAEARAETAFAARAGTLVVIAHRLTSARRARRVLVLDGDRATVGTHESLLRDAPGYRALVGCWSDPAGLAGDLDGLDPGARAGLGDDPGQVVAHGAGRQPERRGDLLDR
jgi:ATP-binding cassette subfamily C protein